MNCKCSQCKCAEQGFLTSTGRFVARIEAGKIAWKAGQTKYDPKGSIIISEEIWSTGNCIYDEHNGYINPGQAGKEGV
jgi:hypothetical protein